MAFISVPHAPRWGERFVVTVSSLDERGHGEALLPVRIDPQGLERIYRVTVPTAIPGDEILVEIGKPRRKQVRGRLVEIERPAEQRRDAPCGHFGPLDEAGTRGCGGCTLQALDYPSQLLQKEARVASLLGADNQATVQPCLPAERPWRYRNKMEFSFGDDPGRQPTVGLHAVGRRHEVIDVRDCLLCSESTMGLVDVTRRWMRERGLSHHDARRDSGWLRTLTIREGEHTGERLIELTTSAVEHVETVDGVLAAEQLTGQWAELIRGLAAEFHVVGAWWTRHDARRGHKTQLHSALLWGRPTYREELRIGDTPPLHFDVHPRAFFQPNTLQAQRIYACAIDAMGATAEDAVVADLYCGTGTIALAVARSVQRVVGVELSAEAVDNARANAARNDIHNVEFECGDVGAVVARWLTESQTRFDVVMVDPPRSGLSTAAIEAVIALGAPRIVYISCNPASLARDVAVLHAAGYELEAAQPVDHFPQTNHVETVAALRRSSPPAARD